MATDYLYEIRKGLYEWAKYYQNAALNSAGGNSHSGVVSGVHDEDSYEVQPGEVPDDVALYERAICALPEELMAVIKSWYYYRDTKEDGARKCVCSMDTYNQRINQAQHALWGFVRGVEQ